MAHDHETLRPAPDEVTDGVPATSEAPPHVDQEMVEGEPAPLDVALGVNEWGTTAAEAQVGEPLDLRRRREVPDRPGRDALDTGDEADLEDLEDTLGAEHAALRVEEEPPGLSYEPDPGYLSDDR